VRIKQEAVLNRKRSSRIATKELEKEELMRRQNAEREMEGRMQSQRLQEKRIAKEETEAVSKEKAREERLREREERAAAREEIRVWEEKEREREEQRGESEVSESSRKRRRGEGKKSDASEIVVPKKAGSSGSQERWEVACEVCKKTGWNIVSDIDGVALMGRMRTMIWSAVMIVEDGSIQSATIVWIGDKVDQLETGTKWTSRFVCLKRKTWLQLIVSAKSVAKELFERSSVSRLPLNPMVKCPVTQLQTDTYMTHLWRDRLVHRKGCSNTIRCLKTHSNYR